MLRQLVISMFAVGGATRTSACQFRAAGVARTLRRLVISDVTIHPDGVNILTVQKYFTECCVCVAPDVGGTSVPKEMREITFYCNLNKKRRVYLLFGLCVAVLGSVARFRATRLAHDVARFLEHE